MRDLQVPKEYCAADSKGTFYVCGMPDLSITANAMAALQEAAETYLVGLLEDGNLCCIHARLSYHNVKRHPDGELDMWWVILGLNPPNKFQYLLDHQFLHSWYSHTVHFTYIYLSPLFSEYKITKGKTVNSSKHATIHYSKPHLTYNTYIQYHPLLYLEAVKIITVSHHCGHIFSNFKMSFKCFCSICDAVQHFMIFSQCFMVFYNHFESFPAIPKLYMIIVDCSSFDSNFTT